jgi:predicted MFS family arabinose efflux permease
MSGQLHWNHAAAGALATANGLGYLLGALLTAPVARRLGVPATFRLGMAVIVAALAANAATDNYPLLLLVRAVAGLAGALVFIAGGVIASRIAAAARSAAPLTLYYAGAGLGIAFSGAVIPALLGHHPGRWPAGWAILAAAACVAACISWTATRGGPTAGPAGGTAAAPFDPGVVVRLWPVTLAYLLFGAGYIAYITFLSAYLVAQRAGVVQVSVTWAVLGLAAVAAPALWSRPLRTWRGALALATALALLGVAAAIPLATAVVAAITVSAIGYGATFLAVPAAITRLVHAAVPEHEWTRALATFTAVFAAGQTAGPYLAGALADRYGTGATLAWTAVLCALGAVLSLLFRPRASASHAGGP